MRRYRTQGAARLLWGGPHSPGAQPPQVGCLRCLASSSVVLQSEVRDLIFAHQMPEGVFELRLLNEEIVLRLQSGRGHGTLVVEGQPFLNSLHASAVREI